MKNIIIGNGININFGGKEYSNEGILGRLETKEIDISHELKNECPKGHNRGFWDEDVTNDLIIKLLKSLFNTVKEGTILNQMVLEKGLEIEKKTRWIKDDRLREKRKRELTSELEEDYSLKKLENIYNTYKEEVEYKKVGLEDYLFLIKFYSKREEEYNENKKYLMTIFNILIYNKGKVNNVKIKENYIKKLKEYDNIFTVNYDSVLENNLEEKDIYHLHGDFKTLDRKYNKFHPLGFKDKYINEYDCMLSNNKIYYSNTLYADNGDDKYQEALGINVINKLIKEKKFIPFYEGLKKLDKENSLISIEAMEEFLKDFDENILYEYYFDNLKEIEGEIELFGISPNNDNHIVELIKENKKINIISYYYYSDFDKEEAKKIFDDRLSLKKSKYFVKDIDEEMV